jgi:hypothetical protein
VAWYPNADKSVKGNSAGSYTGGPYKGVLHTTEGSSSSGAISAFRTHNSWPHFLVGNDGKVWQFLDTKVAARTLRNYSSGPQTNRDSAVQIEITGFAGQPGNHPAAQMNSLKALMRWIEASTGVKSVGPGKPFASRYGQNVRFTNSQWDNFNGWCGHCHVPENDHWDPGTLDMAFLLSGGGTPVPPPPPPPPPSPTPTPPGFNVPASYHTEVPLVPFTLNRPQGGYMIVGGDGGVFTYEGAPFHGSLGGIALNQPIVAGAYTPSGNGYWLIDKEGAIFSFGDAPFKGGLNGTPHLGTRKIIGLVAKGNGYRIVALDPSGDGSAFDVYDIGV